MPTQDFKGSINNVTITGTGAPTLAVGTGGTLGTAAYTTYETGSWTPVWYPETNTFTSVTYRFQNGVYTKIGNVVFISGQISSDAITVGSASGSIQIAGLPFTAIAGQSGAITIGTAADFGGDTPLVANVNPSTTRLRLIYRTSVNGASTLLNVTDLSTATAYGNYIDFSGFYFATP